MFKNPAINWAFSKSDKTNLNDFVIQSLQHTLSFKSTEGVKYNVT